MEQPHSYSTKTQQTQQPTQGQTGGNQERKGPRINRYYENLPPYYKLKSP
jgi:hypothetical protein